MGFRFNRRITILPGVHVNIGLGGASLSVGPRGASINVGRRGTHATLGIPGTGLSYRAKLGGSSAAPAARHTDRAGTILALEEEAAQSKLRLDLVHVDTPRRRPAYFTFDLPKPPLSDVAALTAWRAAKANFEAARPMDEDTTATLIDRALRLLAWPRQTHIAYRIDDSGQTVTIDVDLPEIEDLPTTEMSVDRRALTLVERSIPVKRRQDVYALHVAGIAFRLVGALFAALPGVTRVRLSAYTTRATGGAGLRDDYILAGAVELSAWEQMDLSNLADIDVEDAIRQLGIHMNRTARGLLATVDPCL